MATVIDQSFSLQINILRFVGLYPSKTHPTLQKVKGYVLYFTLAVFVAILLFIKIIRGEYSDNAQMNFLWLSFAQTIFFCLKLAPFLKYSDRLEKCINYFAHPIFLPKDDEERKIIKDCVQVCRRISYFYFNVLVFCLVAWSLPYLLTHRLPADVWLPYDPTKGPVIFYATALYLTTACTYLAFPAPMLDPLFGGLAYYATTQLKILVYNLQNLHNNILNFVAEFEECFSWPVFTQIASSVFGMCFSCIAVILAPARSVDAFKSVGFACALIARIFFYCYFGTLLYEENESFIDAIYMGPWYNYDVKIRKLLIIMMESSKRPMILTTGKIVDLTLATFASLLKTTYSLIAVLRK